MESRILFVCFSSGVIALRQADPGHSLAGYEALVLWRPRHTLFVNRLLWTEAEALEVLPGPVDAMTAYWAERSVKTEFIQRLAEPIRRLLG